MVRAYRTSTANATWKPAPASVSAPVGANCPNQPTDVKLVQFLLKKYYLATPEPSTGPYMLDEITGYCGEKTRGLILDYQRRARKKKWIAPFPDGRVHPDMFTISSLCHSLRLRYGIDVNDMSAGSDPDMPSSLYWALGNDPGWVTVGSILGDAGF